MNSLNDTSLPVPKAQRATIERILDASAGDAILLYARLPDANGRVMRAVTAQPLYPGDAIEFANDANATDAGLLELGAQIDIIRAPSPPATPDLAWIVSLLEAAPATPNLLAIVDPDSFAVALTAREPAKNYHALNGRLIAQALAPYWGPMDPVKGQAASPGLKHYGKIRDQRIRRSILVPYDSRIGGIAGFYGFSLTSSLDIAPTRLLSMRADRLISAAHEAAHALEPLVGIWPEQEHLSEAFADAFAVLAINSRADAGWFREDLALYRDMRTIALLWGDSAHATGLAVTRALKVARADIARDVSEMAEQAFFIAHGCTGVDEGRRERKEWLEQVRRQNGQRPNMRIDHAHLEGCRAALAAGDGAPCVREDIQAALAAFDRIALAGPCAALDHSAARLFRNDMISLVEAARSREEALLGLARTLVSLDRGLPAGLRHGLASEQMPPLVRLRSQLLEQASVLAERLPAAEMTDPGLPVILHVRRSPSRTGEATCKLRRFQDLAGRETAILREQDKAGSRATLLAAAAGRLLRERADLALAVTADTEQLAALRQLDPETADAMIRLAGTALPLLARHGEAGIGI